MEKPLNVDNREKPVNENFEDEVPDTEFYDFGETIRQESFGSDQLWAVYDTSNDGIPRSYARIMKVFYPGFKVKIEWLKADPDGQHEIDWLSKNFPVSCGKFRHAYCQYIEDISRFSHLVNKNIPSSVSYRIYPKMGETWAIFRNWNIKWSADPENHRNYEYDFVEVLSDYDEGSGGITVACLEKMKGFVSLFRQKKGVASFQIPPNELYRCSHRVVPSYRTTGEEGASVPEGAFELDPASLLHKRVEDGTDRSILTQQRKQNQPALDRPSFWTACPFCNIRYEHYREKLNRPLRCQRCMKPFVAYDLNVQAVPSGPNWMQPAVAHQEPTVLDHGTTASRSSLNKVGASKVNRGSQSEDESGEMSGAYGTESQKRSNCVEEIYNASSKRIKSEAETSESRDTESSNRNGVLAEQNCGIPEGGYSQVTRRSLDEQGVIGGVFVDCHQAELYKRLVGKYGEIVCANSREMALCGDLGVVMLRELLNVVEAMEKVRPHELDVDMLDSWELRLRYFEVSCFRVDWLHCHLARFRELAAATVKIHGLEVRLSAQIEEVATKRQELDAAMERQKSLEYELNMVNLEQLPVTLFD